MLSYLPTPTVLPAYALVGAGRCRPSRWPTWHLPLDSAYQHGRGRGGLWKGRVQAQVGGQVGAQVADQVTDQVRDHVAEPK